MAKVTIRKNSWLNFADLLEIRAQQGTSGVANEPFQTFSFWSTPDFPDVVPQTNDQFITIDDQYLGRLDLIAFDAYGDPDLWWVIALANNYQLIPTDMIMNSKIRIPNKSYVDSLLGKGPRK